MTAQAAYREAEILSSSPEQIVLLLYRRLLAALRQGSRHLAAGEIEEKAENFQRATAILYELIAALDHERGGELADRLRALYTFFLAEIAAGSRLRDAERIDRVAALISGLNDSWLAAAESLSESDVVAARTDE